MEVRVLPAVLAGPCRPSPIRQRHALQVRVSPGSSPGAGTHASVVERDTQPPQKRPAFGPRRFESCPGHFPPDWCSGNTPVSKTGAAGSTPASGALTECAACASLPSPRGRQASTRSSRSEPAAAGCGLPHRPGRATYLAQTATPSLWPSQATGSPAPCQPSRERSTEYQYAVRFPSEHGASC